MSTEVTLSSVGVVVRATVTGTSGSAIDISTATSKVLRFRREVEPYIDVAGTFVTDGTNGQIEAAVPDSILARGTCRWQVVYVLGGITYKSVPLTITVTDNL